MIPATLMFLGKRFLEVVFLNPKFLEWAILFTARRLVEHTKTPHDDVFLAKIEEMLKASHTEKEL